MSLQRLLRAFCASLFTVSLAACAAGGTGGPLPAAQPAAAHAAPAKRKLAVKVRVAIPKGGHHRRVRIHGHYVSPATQSITIAVTPSSGPVQHFNADLTPATNPGCKASLYSPTICTVTLNLAAGNYTATFATYDGLLVGGNHPTSSPSGNELSGNQAVPLHVVTGGANQVNVTLDGIPTGVAFVPAATSSLDGNMTAGFTGTKCGGTTPASATISEKVSVLGIDADDNYILGPGAPAPSLALPGYPPAGWALATPAPSSPNTFVLTHPVSSAASGPATLTATITPLAGIGGAPYSAPVPVTIAGGTAICGIFTEYALPNNGSSYAYNHLPLSITAGPDGNMWFTEMQRNPSTQNAQIGSIAPNGTIVEYQDTCNNGATNAEPWSITSGADGNLWFADDGCNRLGKMTTSGQVSYSTVAVSDTQPYGIANGPYVSNQGGTSFLWFTGYTSPIGYVAYAPANGAVSGSPITTGISSTPYGIAEGPDGNEWFTELNGTHIGMSTPSGTITEFAVPTTVCNTNYFFCPSGITAGPDGALWFTDYNGNKIGRITTGGTVTEMAIPYGGSPSAIAVGPDGALWFAQCSGNAIGRITTGGTVTQYVIPTANTGTRGIATGPDGSLWFTEYQGTGIGRLQ